MEVLDVKVKQRDPKLNQNTSPMKPTETSRNVRLFGVAGVTYLENNKLLSKKKINLNPTATRAISRAQSKSGETYSNHSSKNPIIISEENAKRSYLKSIKSLRKTVGCQCIGIMNESNINTIPVDQVYRSKSLDYISYLNTYSNETENKCKTNKKIITPKESGSSINEETKAKTYPNSINTTSFKKNSAEKTTYCRPVLNTYDQENSYYKAIEKQVRLQFLVKKLAQAREREKQQDEWVKYITQLRKKYKFSEPGQLVLPSVSSSIEIVDNYKNGELHGQFARDSMKVINDVYQNYEIVPSRYDYHLSTVPTCPQHMFDRCSYCYPTCSQAQILGYTKSSNKIGTNKIYTDPMRRRVDHSIYLNKLFNQRCRGTTTQFLKSASLKCLMDKSTAIKFVESVLVQTDVENKSNPDYLHNNEDINVKRLNEESGSNTKAGKESISNIEKKLDILINSMNNFIQEIKSMKSKTYKDECEICSFTDYTDTQRNKNKYDVFDFVQEPKYSHGFLIEKSESRKSIPGMLKNDNDNESKVIIREIDQDDQVTRDVENCKSSHLPCAVQITVDIPTKECSTEVTHSVSKVLATINHRDVINNINGSSNTNMTVAVNTDPVGLSALIRISTEALKQFISYVPAIGYNLPSETVCTSHYICHLCGRIFDDHTDLRKHIREHNLANARACCICRHMNSQRPGGVFACQYCGQEFTRAYCREFHEETCARRYGLQHDVPPSLMILS